MTLADLTSASIAGAFRLTPESLRNRASRISVPRRRAMLTGASTANSTARLLSTGSAPGSPRQTGHTFVLGGAPNCVEQPQKILVCVSNWTCTSSPITGSYSWRKADETLGLEVLGLTDMKRLYGHSADLFRRRRLVSRFVHRNIKVEQFFSPGLDSGDI